MTDAAATANTNPDESGEGDVEAKTQSGKMPGKKLVLFAVLPVLVLLAAGAGVYFSGLADPWLGKKSDEAGELLAARPRGPSVYYELEEMLVNLNSRGRRKGYLKIAVSLELGSEKDRALIEQSLPRVIDHFQVYLRELRIEDLQGSAGIQRLREELLLRISTAADPAVVKDVLFREMLIQ